MIRDAPWELGILRTMLLAALEEWAVNDPEQVACMIYSLESRLEDLESKLDQCLHVVREYVSSELADDPSQDDPSCELYPLIELVRKRPGR